MFFVRFVFRVANRIKGEVEGAVNVWMLVGVDAFFVFENFSPRILQAVEVFGKGFTVFVDVISGNEYCQRVKAE
ncbi:MAG TPA: hypothetical protein VGB68_19925 [Pyrinomonadaceae bacterium]